MYIPRSRCTRVGRALWPTQETYRVNTAVNDSCFRTSTVGLETPLETPSAAMRLAPLTVVLATPTPGQQRSNAGGSAVQPYAPAPNGRPPAYAALQTGAQSHLSSRVLIQSDEALELHRKAIYSHANRVLCNRCRPLSIKGCLPARH